MHHVPESAKTGGVEESEREWPLINRKTVTHENDSDQEIDLFPAELEEIVGQFAEPTAKQDFGEKQSAATPVTEETALVTAHQSVAASKENSPEQAAVSPWSSAAKARAWLDSLKAQQPSRDWLAEQWQLHRGSIYIAFGALVLLVVIFQWVMQPSANTERSAFDQMLISLGLAEAPAPLVPEVSHGNPNTRVWVDLQTALYYCPGAELYGKTPKGRYTTQIDAQRDQFNPSTRKACD
jgi:hypothetical protein